MTTIQAINALLIEFLQGEKSLRNFEESLARLTWGVSAENDAAATAARGEVELCLAEYDAGHMDWQEVVTDLIALSQKLAQPQPEESITTSSAMAATHFEITFPCDSTRFATGFSSPACQLV
jgi:hypothetical protein